MDRTKAYALLGLSPGASEGEIKKAYRLFALRTHPDRHSSLDAVSRFKEIKKAYDVLTFPVVSEPVVEPPADFRTLFSRAAAEMRSSPAPVPVSPIYSASPAASRFSTLASRADVMDHYYSFDAARVTSIVRARRSGSSSLEGALEKLFPEEKGSDLVPLVSKIFTTRLDDAAPVLFYAQQVLGDDAPVALTLQLGDTLLRAPHLEAMVGAGSFCRALYDHPVYGRGLLPLQAAEIFSRLYSPVVDRWQDESNLQDLHRLLLASDKLTSSSAVSLAYYSKIDLLSFAFLEGFSLADVATLVEATALGVTVGFDPQRSRRFSAQFGAVAATASRLCAQGYTPAETVDLFSLVASIQRSSLAVNTLFSVERFASFAALLSSSLLPGRVAVGKSLTEALTVGARGYLNENFPRCAEEWRDALGIVCALPEERLPLFFCAQDAFSELYLRCGSQGKGVVKEVYGQGLYFPVLWAAQAGAHLASCASRENLDSLRSFLAGFRSTRYHPGCKIFYASRELTAAQEVGYEILHRVWTTPSRGVQGFCVPKGKIHPLEMSLIYDAFLS